jgi:VIT family
MSLVLLKKWLFGKGKGGGLHEGREEGYGTITADSAGGRADVLDRRPGVEADVRSSTSKGNSVDEDEEATDVDLEAQENEVLLPSRLVLKRSSTSLGSESSSQVQTKRVDARIISDAIIGLSDGLTVPFALTAGLSTLGDVKVVIFGGLAELMAGAISMGLGGYLGAQSEMYVPGFALGKGMVYADFIFSGFLVTRTMLRLKKRRI